MIGLMIFIWVIGFMLTLGLATDSNRDNSTIPKSWFITYIVLALFIWPYLVGVHMKENS